MPCTPFQPASRMLDAIFFVRFSRHDLCPLFLTRARERGRPSEWGPEGRRRRVRRFSPRVRHRRGPSGALQLSASKGRGRRGLQASAAKGAAVCQEVQYLNMCQPLCRGSDIFRGRSTTVMEGRGGGGGDAWRPMAESVNGRQIKIQDNTGIIIFQLFASLSAAC